MASRSCGGCVCVCVWVTGMRVHRVTNHRRRRWHGRNASGAVSINFKVPSHSCVVPRPLSLCIGNKMLVRRYQRVEHNIIMRFGSDDTSRCDTSYGRVWTVWGHSTRDGDRVFWARFEEDDRGHGIIAGPQRSRGKSRAFFPRSHCIRFVSLSAGQNCVLCLFFSGIIVNR